MSATTVRERFLCSKASKQSLVLTQPPIQWVPASFSGCKAGGEVRHTPSSASPSADAKNEWSYTSSPLYAFQTQTGTTLPLIWWCQLLVSLLVTDGQNTRWQTDRTQGDRRTELQVSDVCDRWSWWQCVLQCNLLYCKRTASLNISHVASYLSNISTRLYGVKSRKTFIVTVAVAIISNLPKRFFSE
jgi:hypothetical protein